MLVGAAGGVLVGAGVSRADSSVATVEAETMTSVEGYGTTVQNDSTASAGKRLKVDSNVRVRTTFTLSAPTSYVVVRGHTDSGVSTGARTRLIIDGVVYDEWYFNSASWEDHRVNVSLAAGTHTLTIRFLNAAARNLYLDLSTFWSASAPPPPPPSGETLIQAYITGYSWYDNTPPGSSTISNPVIHSVAGGTGTYADPITVAVGHSIINGQDILDWPAGTRFYIPNLRRYFIVEDTCGDGNTPQNGPCHTGYPSPAATWLDVWVGGQNGTSSGADNCMSAITDVWNAIKDPASDYIVVPGDIYGPPCTTQYGNTAVKA